MTETALVSIYMSKFSKRTKEVVTCVDGDIDGLVALYDYHYAPLRPPRMCQPAHVSMHPTFWTFPNHLHDHHVFDLGSSPDRAGKEQRGGAVEDLHSVKRFNCLWFYGRAFGKV